MDLSYIRSSHKEGRTGAKGIAFCSSQRDHISASSVTLSDETQDGSDGREVQKEGPGCQSPGSTPGQGCSLEWEPRRVLGQRTWVLLQTV